VESKDQVAEFFINVLLCNWLNKFTASIGKNSMGYVGDMCVRELEI
jgi:hypothetical protein